MARPTGYVTIKEFRDESGVIPLQKAFEYGWITDVPRAPRGWGIGRDEIPMGYNLITDTGRQLACYAVGGLSPYTNNVITSFGAGTGLTTPTVLDVTLEAPATFSGGSLYQAVDQVAFPVPFTLQVQFTIDANSMNGLLLTEFGLFSGNNQLMARKLRAAGLNKPSGVAVTQLWRQRW